MKRFIRKNVMKAISSVLTGILAFTTVISTGVFGNTKVSAATAAPQGVTSNLTLNKVAVPVEGMVNTWDITLSVSGQDKTTTSSVVFVIDRSNSMDKCTIPSTGWFSHSHRGNCVTYLDQTKAAAKAAIDTLLSNPNTEVAIVSYGTNVTSDGIFYTNATTAKAAINRIDITDDGATNIQSGIKKAEDLLANKTGLKSVVLLSDGEPTEAYKISAIDTTNAALFNITQTCKTNIWGNTHHAIDASLKDSSVYTITGMDYSSIVGAGDSSTYSYTVNSVLSSTCSHGSAVKQDGFTITNAVVNATLYEANKAKAAGISIYSIALGNVNTVGQNVLKNASSDSVVYTASASTLSDVYANIAGKIMYAASNAVVTDPMGENFNMVIDKSAAQSVRVSQGTFSYNEATETINWNLGNVSNNNVATMTYRVTVDPTKLSSLVDSNTVAYPTNKTTTINYINNNGVQASQNFVVPQVGIAKFYNVTYVVDGDATVVVDSNDYRTGFDVTVKADVPTKNGYKFLGWTLAGDNSGKVYTANEVVEDINSDLIFTAAFVKEWTVSYVLDGTTLTDLTKVYTEGTDVSAVIAEAYVRSLVADKVDASKLITSVSSSVNATAITSNIVVTITTADKEYKVTYFVNGSKVGEETVLYGQDAQGVKYSSEEFVFNGWGELPKNVKADQEVRVNLNKREFVVTYTIDNKFHATESVKYGEDAKGVAYTAPEGYNFSGWTLPTNVKSNVTVNASLTKKVFTVTYTVDNKFYATESVKYDENAKGVDYTAPEGYNFSGWTLPTNVKADVTVNASLTKKVFTVTYTINGNDYRTESVEYGNNAQGVAYDVPTGYDFTGWTLPTNITENVTVDAQLTKKVFTVTYTVNGNNYRTESVEYGNNAQGVAYNVPTGYDFTGWTLPTNVTENVTVDAQLTKKVFTVTYTVNDVAYDTESVEYGNNAQGVAYNVPTGYNFTGWVLPTNVTENVTVDAQLTKKEFTVTYVDENGTVLSTEVVKFEEATKKEVKNPTKADNKQNGNAETQTPAIWEKFSFDKWVAAGNYTTADTQSVTENMTFTATYKKSSVNVKYYVLNLGLAQPSELSHYSAANYSKGSIGTLYAWEQVANDNDKVASILAQIPTSFKKYNSNEYLTLEDGQEIVWYVVKSESDNWHVDGIVTNQKYTLTVNYAVMDVDGNVTPMDKESRTEEIIATQNYSVEADAIDGFQFNEDATVELNAISGVAGYENIEVTLIYEKLVTVTYTGLKNQDGTDRDDVVVTGVAGNFIDSVKLQYSAGKYTISVFDEEGNEIAKETYTCQPYGYTNLNTGRTSWKVLEEDITRILEDTTFQPKYKLLATRVTEYMLTINYVYEDGTPVVDENGEAVIYTELVPNGTQYSVESVVVDNFKADLEVVEGIMPAKDKVETVVYTEILYNLTINYVYEDGTPVVDENGEAIVYTDVLSNGAEFSVESITVEGYETEDTVVEGVIESANKTITVVFTEVVPEEEPTEESTEETEESSENKSEDATEESTEEVTEESTEETSGEVEADEETEESTEVVTEESTEVVTEESTEEVTTEEATEETTEDKKGEVEADEETEESTEEETTTSNRGEVEADEDPETGDNSGRTISLLLLTMAAAMITFILFYKKRDESEEV